jgi:5-methylthioadenosine/S-adenosylhomocysteine deaminase
VNAHTHLELTGLRGLIEDDEFFTWIQHLRSAKSGLDQHDFVAAAQQGLRECWRFGITAVGDTGDTGATCTALTGSGGRGVFYQEVFGPHPDQAVASLGILESQIDALLDEAGPRVTIGISPHAPYSVSEALFRLSASFARERGLPTASHAAESRAEQELVTSFAGPFATMWRAREIPAPEVSRSTVGLLERAGALDPDLLLIHGVRFSDDDMDTVARCGSSVVLCPGSNLRHGHGLPRARQILDRGITLSLGTDSVASVADTNLLREARIAVDELGVSTDEAVRMMTVGGARALGQLHAVGSLEEGKAGDLCCLRIGNISEPQGVATAVVHAGPDDFLETYVEGSLVYAAFGIAG